MIMTMTNEQNTETAAAPKKWRSAKPTAPKTKAAKKALLKPAATKAKAKPTSRDAEPKAPRVSPPRWNRAEVSAFPLMG
jgi:hypothetical protein